LKGKYDPIELSVSVADSLPVTRLAACSESPGMKGRPFSKGGPSGSDSSRPMRLNLHRCRRLPDRLQLLYLYLAKHCRGIGLRLVASRRCQTDRSSCTDCYEFSRSTKLRISRLNRSAFSQYLRANSNCGCGCGKPSPGTDMWQWRAQSRCRCGRGRAPVPAQM
jgi:hypothetical protein